MFALTESKSNFDMLRQITLLGRVPARKLTREVLRDIMKPTFATALSLVPVDEGALRASLKLRSIARTRRGIGVLITTTGELTRAKRRKFKAFEGDGFYASMVHWGHRFVNSSTAKPNNAMFGIKPRKRRTLLQQRSIGVYEEMRTRGRFPGIPFLKEAGDMHRDRMNREFIQKMNEGIAAALTTSLGAA